MSPSDHTPAYTIITYAFATLSAITVLGLIILETMLHHIHKEDKKSRTYARESARGWGMRSASVSFEDEHGVRRAGTGGHAAV